MVENGREDQLCGTTTERGNSSKRLNVTEKIFKIKVQQEEFT